MTDTPSPTKQELQLRKFEQFHAADLNKVLNDKFSDKYFVSNIDLLIPSMKNQAADIPMIQKEIDDFMDKIKWTAFKLIAESISKATGGYILRPYFN